MTDLIIHGGRILTLDDRQPQATAIVVRGGRVIAVGNDDLLSLRCTGTETIDLAGRTLCPGFIDAHNHFALTAWCQLGVDLAECNSAAQACDRIGRQASAVPTETWIYAYNYEPDRFAGGHRLTRYDLDRAVGGRLAIAIHVSYHEAVASSAGLRAAGITRYTKDPAGGRIVRDRKGEPTGELLETAAGPVEALARTAAAGTSYDDWLAAAERYCKALFAEGITHVCDPGVDAMLEGYLRRAEAEGHLPLPVTAFLVSRLGLFQPPEDRMGGPATRGHRDGADIAGLKLFADGGSRCAVCVGLLESLAGLGSLVIRAVRLRRPALLLSPHSPDRPRLRTNGRIHLGYLHYTRDDLATMCARAAVRGFRLAVHAAGNAAIDNVLSAFEQREVGHRRHRVEHLVVLDGKQAHRLAEVGAIGVVQPAYIRKFGDAWNAMLTPPRLRSIPLRTLLDAGLDLAGSSDSPVASSSPLQGMHAAVTRRTDGGTVHQADEAISPLEALRLWTTGAALAVDKPAEIGKIRPGARADLVILSDNPLETPPEAFPRIRVVRTLVAGRTVFSDGR